MPQLHASPRRWLGSTALFSVFLGLTAACSGSHQDSTSTPETATPETAAAGAPLRPLAGDKLGDPIPGLLPDELAAFERGKVIFGKRFTPDEGLGPNYNATSCQSCHSTPVMGGASELYRNFYISMIGTAPNQTKFGQLPSPVVPAFGPHALSDEFGLEHGRFVIPDTFFGFPVQTAQRNSIPVFGTGLFEFISNGTILANHDPLDVSPIGGDGISGRANYDFGDLGRFGVKAQSNNIERFTRPPLRNQMGITSDPFLGSAGTISASLLAAQGTGDPDLPLTDDDGVPDPEISEDDLGDLIAFSRFLAPPDRLPFDTEALQGQSLFDSIGCAKCHIPSLTSSLGPVEAYTDLLLHNMGPDLADGLQFGAPDVSGGGQSTGEEFRTQPLWGVSLFPPYLHDGRAPTLRSAVEQHGGEAEASRNAFVALSTADQAALISFLEKL